MPIARDEVLRIARLARLELQAAEIDELVVQLGSVLDYVARLDELQLPDEPASPPAAPAPADGPRWRSDDVRESLDPAEAVSNAPDPAGGLFRVPRSFPE